jgi:hypothetical protein
LAVGERGVAGAEDAIRPKLDIELGFQRCADIDIAEHAETLLLESFCDFCDGCIERQL